MDGATTLEAALSAANDGVASATMSKDKEEQKKSGKKKEVTCYARKLGIMQPNVMKNCLSRCPQVDLIC